MELKCCTESRLLKSVCSNRTFMELKFRSQGKVNVTKKSSNRTFMELKYKDKGLRSSRYVLIAPLWN